MTLENPTLQFATFRFVLKAVDSIHIPPNAGSTLRGGFGSSFRRTACFQRNRKPENCDSCSVNHSCPYGYIFETRLPPNSEVLRSLSEIPHPFILEPPLNPPPVYQPGAPLEFRVVLVGMAIAYLPYFAMAFLDLGGRGLGRGRGRFQLEEIAAEHPLNGRSEPIYRDGSLLPCSNDLTATYSDLLRRCEGISPDRVTVHFLTPTRLISGERLATHPTFPVLIRAAIRRISSLSYFHCGRRWETDYAGLVAASEEIRLISSDLRWEEWERYSSRQDARMKLGGLVGSATYEGPIAPFLPILLAAGVVHLGKACTFGNGRLRVEW